MTQSYAVALAVCLALITASCRLSTSFDLHEEEPRREQLIEQPPPSRFVGPRDHGRPRDDHHPPPPPMRPKTDRHQEHIEDREDDDDDLEDDLPAGLEHRPPYRKHRPLGPDVPSRMSELERNSNGDDLRHYGDREENDKLSHPLFHRTAVSGRPSEVTDEGRRHDDERAPWWKTDKKRWSFDGDGDLVDESPEEENNNRDGEDDDDDFWSPPSNDDRNRKYESTRHRLPSVSERHRLQQKLHYGAMLRTSNGKPRPGWRSKVDFNGFDDRRKRTL